MASIELDEEKEAVQSTGQNKGQQSKTQQASSLHTGVLNTGNPGLVSTIKENTRQLFKGMGAVSAFFPESPVPSSTAASTTEENKVKEAVIIKTESRLESAENQTAPEAKKSGVASLLLSLREKADKLKDQTKSFIESSIEILNTTRQEVLEDISKLGNNIKQSFDSLWENISSRLSKIYKSFTEFASNVITKVKEFFKNEDEKSDTINRWADISVIKKLYEFFTNPVDTTAGKQPGNSSPLSEIEDSYNRKLKGLVQDIVSATLTREEKEKDLTQAEIEIRQKKLTEQADRAFAQAIQMRPDLASRLQRPQVAFLASSPFAEAPSAGDLIEQAEKLGIIH